MARGLSDALRDAFEPLRAEGTRCPTLYCDVTHEAATVRELQIIIARFGATLATDFLLQTPARELGAVGAATLPLYAVLAAEAWLRAINDVRLAMGTRLDISGDTDLGDELDDAVLHDPASSRVFQVSVYAYLGYLQESLLNALPEIE